MSITLRLPPATHTMLNEMAHDAVESAGVLLAHSRTDGDRTILTAFDLIPVPEDAYEVRTDHALQITSDGYVHALKVARDRGAIAIWVHTHPGNHSIPKASRQEPIPIRIFLILHRHGWQHSGHVLPKVSGKQWIRRFRVLLRTQTRRSNRFLMPCLNSQNR